MFCPTQQQVMYAILMSHRLNKDLPLCIKIDDIYGNYLFALGPMQCVFDQISNFMLIILSLFKIY